MPTRELQKKYSLRNVEPALARLRYGTRAPRELVETERRDRGARGEVSIVFPSTAPDKEINQQALGRYMAGWITGHNQEALTDGAIPVIALPTGGTSRPLWPALSEMVASGQLDLTKTILTGNEAAFGDLEAGGPVDYDRYRRERFAEILEGIPLIDIEDPHQLEGDSIPGNYLSMTAGKGTDSKSRADASAKLHDNMIHALQKRGNVRFIGVYGVGKDGHVAEIQVNTLTGAADYDTSHAFPYSITHNRIHRGAHRFPEDTNHEFHNEMGEPGDDPNYHGAEYLIGPGWEDLLLHDELMLAFNDSSKSFAFQSTMEGSVDAILATDTGEHVAELTRQPGRGEEIYTDMLSYARELVDRDLLNENVVDTIDAAVDEKRCKMLFKEIYASLHDNYASLTPDDAHGILEHMWSFGNEYIGKQTPVSVLVRLRTLLGLNTTIVATPEVVKDTPYEHLAPVSQ